MSKKIICKKEWTDISQKWSKGYPPERPSKGEVEIYEDYIQKVIRNCNGKCKALILGATPELRDLLAKYNIETTIADINYDMIMAMKELLEYSSGEERLIVCNWLEVELESNQFDIILCDHGLHWIFFEEWDVFLKDKVRLLKEDGYFINNVVTVEEKEVIKDIKKIAQMCKNNLISREDKLYYHYRAMLGLPDKDNKKYCKNLDDYGNEINKLLKENFIDEQEAKFLSELWEGFSPIMPPKEAVDEKISQYFNIKSIGINFKHPVFTCHKIYFCKKK